MVYQLVISDWLLGFECCHGSHVGILFKKNERERETKCSTGKLNSGLHKKRVFTSSRKWKFLMQNNMEVFHLFPLKKMFKKNVLCLCFYFGLVKFILLINLRLKDKFRFIWKQTKPIIIVKLFTESLINFDRLYYSASIEKQWKVMSAVSSVEETKNVRVKWFIQIDTRKYQKHLVNCNGERDYLHKKGSSKEKNKTSRRSN